MIFYILVIFGGTPTLVQPSAKLNFQLAITIRFIEVIILQLTIVGVPPLSPFRIPLPEGTHDVF
jgi:hypothetical protein